MLCRLQFCSRSAVFYGFCIACDVSSRFWARSYVQQIVYMHVSWHLIRCSWQRNLSVVAEPSHVLLLSVKAIACAGSIPCWNGMQMMACRLHS